MWQRDYSEDRQDNGRDPATMTTIKKLQTRVDQANRWLSQELPPKVRRDVATVKLVARLRIALRRKFPELDQEERVH